MKLDVIPTKPRLILDPKRKCGRCQVCCSVMGVSELKKDPNHKCDHQVENGCGIYDKRPPTCQGFYCAWRLGYFTESDRPDKIGVLFHFSMGTKLSDGPVLTMETVDITGNYNARAFALIKQEANRQLVYLRTGGTRKLVGPDAELERIRPLIDDLIRKETQNGLTTSRHSGHDTGASSVD